MSQMKLQTVTHYDFPHRFAPLLPSEAMMGPLLEQASDLTRKATALGTASGHAAHSEVVSAALRQRGVAVGQHEALAWEALPDFLKRWQMVYVTVRGAQKRSQCITSASRPLGHARPMATASK
jgi:hypothetical protein